MGTNTGMTSRLEDCGQDLWPPPVEDHCKLLKVSQLRSVLVGCTAQAWPGGQRHPRVTLSFLLRGTSYKASSRCLAQHDHAELTAVVMERETYGAAPYLDIYLAQVTLCVDISSVELDERAETECLL